jgi:hypothetical protein
MANEISSVKNALSVLVVALVIALYLFANSTFFEAETIEWTGLNYLSPDQLEVFLDLPVTNVWRLDTRELAGVLMEHPWVVTAKAESCFSSRPGEDAHCPDSHGGWLGSFG